VAVGGLKSRTIYEGNARCSTHLRRGYRAASASSVQGPIKPLELNVERWALARECFGVERWTLKTQTGNPALIKFIRDEVKNRGPISFAWFMQQALYHPEHGYYSSGHSAIGRKGDYFTNVSVGPVFGQLILAQFAEIWERLGKINGFVIVEQGAHNGQFARDVLQASRERTPEFFEALRYRIIEPFPILRERQSQMLEPFGDKIEWSNSLEPFTGIHFSNELLDAMPVRLITGDMEKLVDLQGDEFVFIERPLSSIMFNEAALTWVDSIAADLQRGYVIAIDYGHPGDEFQGAVQVRARHRRLGSPFEQIGHADITMHVDWTSIARRAEENGLRVVGFTDQHHFLTGIISELRGGASPEPPEVDWSQSPLPDSPKAKRALQTLLHPEMLGRAFQVLALTRDVDRQTQRLAGFKFAREAGSILGLGKPSH
jgi:SAM-dependent MidA family methyltransferase